jgi:hypothetical protein
MVALSEARAIQISPVVRPPGEDDICYLCGDATVRKVPNHSGIDNTQMVRIPGERLCGLSHSSFCATWHDAHCHSVS